MRSGQWLTVQYGIGPQFCFKTSISTGYLVLEPWVFYLKGKKSFLSNANQEFPPSSMGIIWQDGRVFRTNPTTSWKLFKGFIVSAFNSVVSPGSMQLHGWIQRFYLEHRAGSPPIRFPPGNNCQPRFKSALMGSRPAGAVSSSRS